MFTENMAKREKVDNKQKGSKDRTLGNTRGEGGGVGSECFELDKQSRYDLNQCRGVSDNPRRASRSMRMVWEMVSKAALRSRRMRTVQSLQP